MRYAWNIRQVLTFKLHVKGKIDEWQTGYVLSILSASPSFSSISFQDISNSLSSENISMQSFKIYFILCISWFSFFLVDLLCIEAFFRVFFFFFFGVPKLSSYKMKRQWHRHGKTCVIQGCVELEDFSSLYWIRFLLSSRDWPKDLWPRRARSCPWNSTKAKRLKQNQRCERKPEGIVWSESLRNAGLKSMPTVTFPFRFDVPILVT